MKNTYTEAAKYTVEAIARLAANPEALANFEAYLTHHYAEWLQRYASTPNGLAYELNEFADGEPPIDF